MRMQVTKIKEEIAQLDEVKLRDKLNQLKYSLFDLRINSTTAHVKDYSQFKKVRKDIARVLTALKKQQLVSERSNNA